MRIILGPGSIAWTDEAKLRHRRTSHRGSRGLSINDDDNNGGDEDDDDENNDVHTIIISSEQKA